MAGQSVGPGDSRCDDDPEEIPQASHERAAGELIGQKTPRKWCSADESGKEPDVGSEILDGRATKLIELRKNRPSWRPLEH